jgi:hypothetical protein
MPGAVWWRLDVISRFRLLVFLCEFSPRCHNDCAVSHFGAGDLGTGRVRFLGDWELVGVLFRASGAEVVARGLLLAMGGQSAQILERRFNATLEGEIQWCP